MLADPSASLLKGVCDSRVSVQWLDLIPTKNGITLSIQRIAPMFDRVVMTAAFLRKGFDRTVPLGAATLAAVMITGGWARPALRVRHSQWGEDVPTGRIDGREVDIPGEAGSYFTQ